MESQTIDWKKMIVYGVIAGVIWGWLAVVINTVSKAFTFEETLLQLFVTFTAGGAIFGIIVSGVLSLTHYRMHFRNIFLGAIFISVALWGILEAGGILFHLIEPERYHIVPSQIIQGFVLAVIMGCLLGLLRNIGKKEG